MNILELVPISSEGQFHENQLVKQGDLQLQNVLLSVEAQEVQLEVGDTEAVVS